MKGGNTEELYRIRDGRLKMAESLAEQHPDLVVVTEKWGRPQHHVNYEPFRRNRLRLREDAGRAKGVDEYGMKLQHWVDGRWVDDSPLPPPKRPY